MGSDKCSRALELQHWVHRTLSDSQQAALAAHVEQCDDCKIALAGNVVPLSEFTERANGNGNDNAAQQSSQSQSATGGGDPQRKGDQRPAGILGEYRILRPIARGGMGVVYEAEQQSLGRRVALKTLPMAALLDQRALQRFKNEARAAASLHHPHIVPVHGYGVENGLHYYAMQYIEGCNLALMLKAARNTLEHGHAVTAGHESIGVTRIRPQDSTAAPDEDGWEASVQRIDAPAIAESPGSRRDNSHGDSSTTVVRGFVTQRESHLQQFFLQVCHWGVETAEALAYAHERGVVHRDIKPSNLIIDTDGHLWVTDFGVAHIESEATLTLSGDIVGTVRYMSPEQAAGRRGVVDHRTDIYSLGATLYELLTLRPLHTGTDRKLILSKVLTEQPPAPRAILPAIPVDLETIVLTAISKDVHERYATADDLAADLRSFLAKKPIRARRPGPIERAARWMRRHQALTAALLGVAALTTILVVAAFITLSVYNERYRAISKKLSVSNEQLRSALADARTARLDSEVHRERADNTSYALTVRLAYQAAEKNDLSQTASLLHRLIPEPGTGDADLREFAARHLQERLAPSQHEIPLADGPLYDLTMSPDGTQYAIAGEGGKIILLDDQTWLVRHHIQTRIHDVNGLAFSPDGKLLASAEEDGSVALWSCDTGVELARRQLSSELIYAVAFIPHRDWLAAAGDDGNIYICDSSLENVLTVLPGPSGAIYEMAVSPDGELLATASQDRSLTVWNLGEERRTQIFEDSRHRPTSVAFAPDGRTLVSGHVHGVVHLWPLDAAEPLTIGNHADDVRSVCFLRNGTEVVAADRGGRIAPWTVPDWSSCFDSTESAWIQIDKWKATDSGGALWCGLTADGQTGIVVLNDRLLIRDLKTARVGEVARPELPYASPEGPNPLVAACSWNGALFVCGNEVYVWTDGELDSWKWHLNLEVDPQSVAAVGFPDEDQVLIVLTNGQVQVFDQTTGAALPAPIDTLPIIDQPSERQRTHLVVSRDARWIAWLNDVGNVRLFESSSGQVVQCEGGEDVELGKIAISADGTCIAGLSDSDHLLRFWDTASGSLRSAISLEIDSRDASTVTLSSDGRYCMVGRFGLAGFTSWTDSETGEVWHIETTSGISGFSHSGNRCFTSTLQGKVSLRVWERRNGLLRTDTTGKEDSVVSPVADEESLPGWQSHFGRVSALTTTADDAAVLSIGSDGVLRIWQRQPVSAAYTLGPSDNMTFDICRSRELVTAAGMRGVDIYSARSGRLELLWSIPGPRCRSATLSSDGSHIAVGRERGPIEIWVVSTQRKIMEWSLAPDYTGSRMRFSPDGRTLAVAVNDQETQGDSLHLYDVSTGQRLPGPRLPLCDAICFTANGKRLFAGSGNDLVVCDIAAPGIETTVAGGHANALAALALSPDQRILASGGHDRRILLWDVRTLDLLAELHGQASEIRDLDFSPDGCTLVSAGRTDGIRLWHVPTQLQLCHFCPGPHVQARFHPDGSQLLGLSEARKVTVFTSGSDPDHEDDAGRDQ